MPIYEYECETCRCRFERKQRFDEEPVSVCSQCGGKSRRVIHSAPIIFKGSGFYVTDSRKSNPAGDGEKPAATEKAKEPAESKPKEAVASKPAEPVASKAEEKA